MTFFDPELLDEIPIALAVADDAGAARIRINRHFARLLGNAPRVTASSGATPDNPDFTFVRDGHVVAADDQPMQTAARTNAVVCDWRAEVVRTDGERIPIVAHALPVRDASGVAIGSLGIFLHASAIDRDRHLADAQRLAAIVASSDDPIIGKDLDGIVTAWNPAAERLFGYSAREIVGKSIRTIIPADRSHEEDEVLARIRQGQRVENFETMRVTKDGQLVEVALTISPIKTADGRIVGASKIVHDLTPLRERAMELERQVRQRTADLQAVNARLEAFAFSVAHDLRAPLRGMHGFSQALLEDYGDRLDEVGRDYARRIVQEAASMDMLIQDLLAYGRLAHIELPVTSVGLVEVMDSALHVVREEAADREAVIDVDRHLPTVTGNRSVLVQVFTNLLSNAIKFGGPQPRIRVWAETRADGMAHVWVEDQGIGIAPEYHERIFAVFERLHGAEAYPGTGIGLAIVRKGIERLGGRVGVESAEGRGSRFWIELPQVEAA